VVEIIVEIWHLAVEIAGIGLAGLGVVPVIVLGLSGEVLVAVVGLVGVGLIAREVALVGWVIGVVLGGVVLVVFDLGDRRARRSACDRRRRRRRALALEQAGEVRRQHG